MRTITRHIPLAIATLIGSALTVYWTIGVLVHTIVDALTYPFVIANEVLA